MSSEFKIDGFCEERFNSVKNIFEKNFEEGLEEIGYKIAPVEINLLNLNDLIEEEVNRPFRFRWCLKNHIHSATYRLEYALIKVSLGLDIYCILTQALEKLDRAKREVEWNLNRREISQELADLVLLKLEQAQEDIIDIRNSI